MLARNEGSADRIVRVMIGLLLLSLIIIGPSTLLGLIGLVPLITGIVGYCPLYQMLGIRTCPAP